MGETSSIVSRRPPLSVSTSHSKERRWMSIRFGTSRAFSRRENERRVRAASTRDKAANSFGYRLRGEAGRAQSATHQNSRLNYSPLGGGCRPVVPGGAAITDPVPRRPEYVPARLSRDGCGYRPLLRVARLRARSRSPQRTGATYLPAR